MTLSILTDRTLVRAAASSTRYVLARITAPRAPERETRIPANVGIVLDRSGSMSEERKFVLAREAVEQSLRMLRPEDRFALVVYDYEPNVLMPSTRATPEMKRRALDALRDVEPRGGTDLGAGWLRGCEQVAEFLYDDGVSRCLLLTDGLANQGITDRDELARHAGELRQRGVSTSTFGVGADFDERLLRDMAHEGGGNFYFIEGAPEISAMLTGELGEALEVTLRNASLVVTLPAGAAGDTLNRYRQTSAGPNELRVDVGDLVSSQELDIVLKVTFPSGEVGRQLAVACELASGGEPIPGTARRQEWTYATHHDNDVQPRNREVDGAVAEVYAARARAEATELNRHSRYDDARHVLEATANRILRYSGSDARLRDVAEELVRRVHEYEAPMTLMSVKASLYAAETRLKGRDSTGRARR